MKTSLSFRGYSVMKADLDADQLRYIRRDLTVKPFVLEEYANTVKPFPIYLESEKRLYMPRYYGLKRFGTPAKVSELLTSYDEIDVPFKGKLRPAQEIAVRHFLDVCPLHKKEPESFVDYQKGGILSLHTGAGKTVCALNIISKIKAKTLIIVHKTFLMNQWKERITTFLPEARVGTIQQKCVDIEDKDIVIAMLQSISMKDYPKNTFSSFGLCIIDEAHHLGAEVFSRCLPKIGCEFNLGLSATPQRSDGLTRVFKWWIGPIVYQLQKRESMPVNAIQLHINDPHKPYSKEELTVLGKVCMPRMVNNVCAYSKRTNFIVHLLKLLVKDGRTILVLSGRRQHLEDIYTTCIQREAGTVGFYVGGMKQKDLSESESKNIILGTYSMASEGLDIKQLNTILFASPMTNVVQAVGRILRKRHDITPEIYDLVDNFSSFINQGVKRRRFYCRENYTVYSPEIACCGDAIETICDLSQLRTNLFEQKRGRKPKERKCMFLP